MVDTVGENSEAILKVARRNVALTTRVFGWMAVHESTAHSHLDFLVDMEPGRSQLDMGRS